MNIKYLACGIAALAMANIASAVTIDISGATAFRTAAIRAIVTSYGAGLTNVAHNGGSGDTAHEGAQYSIFKGTFPGIGPDTVIRCTWTGSVEGIRDLAVPQTQNFLTEAAFTAGTAYPFPGGAAGRHSVGAGSNPAFPKFAFSDVFGTSSPYDVSNLTDTRVGVLPFIPVVNEGAPAELTNITSQQFRAIWSNGSQPLSLFYPTSDPRRVYATGRNDLSGTRTTYLAETGYGISTPVNQWRPTLTGDAITILRRWPTGVDAGVDVSSVWNGTGLPGNGGFNSGGGVSAALQATSTNVQLQNAAGVNTGSPTSLLIVSIIGSADAATAQAGGGKALSYNGVKITPAATSGTPLAAGDIAKITSGSYTLWSYEHLFYHGSLDEAEQAVFDALLDNIPANLGSTGISENLMNVGRIDDGDVVAP